MSESKTKMLGFQNYDKGISFSLLDLNFHNKWSLRFQWFMWKTNAHSIKSFTLAHKIKSSNYCSMMMDFEWKLSVETVLRFISTFSALMTTMIMGSRGRRMLTMKFKDITLQSRQGWGSGSSSHCWSSAGHKFLLKETFSRGLAQGSWGFKGFWRET